MKKENKMAKMEMGRMSKVICLLLCMLNMSLLCVAQSKYTYKTYKVNSRTITEKISSSGWLYYTIDEFTGKTEQIKKSRIPYVFNFEPAYPIWHSEKRFLMDARSLVLFCQKIFDGYKKKKTAEEMSVSVQAILTEDGKVLCSGLSSKIRLLDYFTANEISEIFDKVSEFKFTTPLMSISEKGQRRPINGYHELDFESWWSDGMEESYQERMKLYESYGK